MTNDNKALDDMKKDGQAENRHGWSEEAKGQAAKVTGSIIGDKAMHEDGKHRQEDGNAMKHEGKAVQHTADAAKEMKKATPTTV